MAIDGIKIFDEECETGKFFLILILLKNFFNKALHECADDRDL